MPSFSQKSKDKLATCHPTLQSVMNEAIKQYDFTVLCGHRGEQEQNAAFKNGSSMLQWPKGKHNKLPSHAVDVAPYPIDWDNIQRFRDLAVVVKACAEELGIAITWGGDWKRFTDYPHWELP